MSAAIRYAVALLGLSACTLATDPWSYTEIDLEAGLERLHPGCAACLASRCRTPYDECAATPSCVNHTACRGEDPSPAGRLACGGLTDEPGFARLTSCVGCNDACGFGTNWACVGSYSFAPAPRVVRWSQRLVDNDSAGGRRPFVGATVRACRRPGVACGPAFSDVPEPGLEQDLVAWSETDESGWFTLTLPVEAGGSGFEGVLVVSGADIPTYRLHHTAPLVTASSETELFSNDSLTLLLLFAGIPPADTTRANVLFQVHDCLMRPARDVTVMPILGEPPLILYSTGTQGELPTQVATTEAGQGTGALLSLDPETKLVPLEFRLGDAVVNKAVVTVAAGEVSVLQVGPGSSAETAPW